MVEKSSEAAWVSRDESLGVPCCEPGMETQELRVQGPC